MAWHKYPDEKPTEDKSYIVKLQQLEYPGFLISTRHYVVDDFIHYTAEKVLEWRDL